jgi:hypothetical protein
MAGRDVRESRNNGEMGIKAYVGFWEGSFVSLTGVDISTWYEYLLG